MTITRTLAAAALAAVLTAATPLLAPVHAPVHAHEIAKGRHGGPVVHAGKYHTELLVDGSTSVTVYLSDADDKPIPAAGFKATAILIIDGKSQRIELKPAGDSKMVGSAPAPVKPGVKGVVQLTAPDGSTAQGKY